MHLGGGGDTDEALIGGDNAESVRVEREAPPREVASAIATEDGFMEWRDVLVKPDGSEFWHYYPDIPDYAKPGDPVVFSAFAHGFVDWEVETRANVEILDKYTDAGFMYLTMVMPDEDFVVRALYEDIVMVVHEPLGSGAFVAASTLEPVTLVDNLVLPPGMVDIEYNVVIIPDDYQPAGTVWRWQSLTGLPNVDGFDFRQINKDQAVIFSEALTPPTVPATYRFEIVLSDPDPENPGEFIDRAIYRVTLEILPMPEITTDSPLPDGMVNWPYSVPIAASPLPSPFITWSAFGLPAGWSINPETGVISSTPTVDGPMAFTVYLESTDQNTNIGYRIEKDFAILIWEEPVIEEREFAPGMEGQPFANGFNVLTARDVPDDAEWRWRVDRGNFPPGLDLSRISNESATIHGTPTTAGEYTFIVRLESTDPNASPFIGYAEQEFTIIIRKRPSIMDTPRGGGLLKDGMVGVGTGSTEPNEDYFDYIHVADKHDVPESATWVWSYIDGTSPDPANDLPRGVTLRPAGSIVIGDTDPNIAKTIGFIDGTTTDDTVAGAYTFTVIATITDSTSINVGEIEIDREFTIRVWQRTYLHIKMEPDDAPDGLVRRVPIREETGENWPTVPPRPARPPTFRAVIPGNKGEIRAQKGTFGFVRWEVESGWEESNRTLEIGRESNTPQTDGFRTDEMYAYVTITMPGVWNPAGSAPDVTLRGAIAPEPVINPNLPVGTRTIRYPGSFSLGYRTIIDPLDLYNIGKPPNGSPYTRERWRLIGGDLRLTGLQIVEHTGIVDRAVAGAPTTVGDFTFTVGLVLPGTMIIEEVHTISIEEFRVLWGDVNGDRTVDLSDLIALSLWLGGDRSFTINEEAADVNGDGFINMTDLNILAAFFAQPNVHLGPPRPIITE